MAGVCLSPRATLREPTLHGVVFEKIYPAGVCRHGAYAEVESFDDEIYRHGQQLRAKRIRKNVRVRIPFRRQQMFAAAAACSRCQRFRHVAPMDRLEVGARVQPWPKDIVFQGLLRAKRRPLFHPSCPVASLRPPRVARHIQCIVCKAAERRSLVHE
jgi:hypothetical protein